MEEDVQTSRAKKREILLRMMGGKKVLELSIRMFSAKKP